MLLCVSKFKTMQFCANTSVERRKTIVYYINRILLNYIKTQRHSIFEVYFIKRMFLQTVNKTTASQNVTRRLKNHCTSVHPSPDVGHGIGRELPNACQTSLQTQPVFRKYPRGNILGDRSDIYSIISTPASPVTMESTTNRSSYFFKKINLQTSQVTEPLTNHVQETVVNSLECPKRRHI